MQDGWQTFTHDLMLPQKSQSQTTGFCDLDQWRQVHSAGRKVMNSWLKWDEACPHLAHFHRLTFCTGTDEDIYPENVNNHQGKTNLILGIETNLELTQGDN